MQAMELKKWYFCLTANMKLHKDLYKKEDMTFTLVVQQINMNAKLIGSVV